MGSAELMARKLEAGSPLATTLNRILQESERMAELVKKIGQITEYKTKPYLGVTNILDLEEASKNEDNRS